MKKQLPYRPCAGIMLLNQENMVFVARRIDTSTEAWQMPQGGIDKGEEPAQAARRELMEEIGTNKAKIITESNEWHMYDLPDELIGKVWKGKYRGQRQKWFLMRFIGKDSEININTENPEFSQWKWIQPEKLTEIIVPFKKTLYENVLKEFSSELKRFNI